MKLSIIIVNWNSTDLCIELLNSIKAFPPSCNFETILVDNNSMDMGVYSFEDYKNLKIIKNKDNYKYAKANNQGIEVATGEYLLFFNPDIIVKERSIDKLIEFLDNNKDYFAVAPRLILPDGNTDMSIRGFPYLFPLLCDILKINEKFKSATFDYYRKLNFDYSKDADIEQPMTSALLVRRSILDTIGNFDEDFPIFFNDVDLLYRANKAGYKVRYIANSEMDHIHGASTKRASKKKMQYHSYNSLLDFYKKNFTQKYTFLGIGLMWLLIKSIIKAKNLTP